MINTDPAAADADTAQPTDAAVATDPARPARRAPWCWPASRTAVVVAIWFAFYLLVFVPRAGAP